MSQQKSQYNDLLSSINQLNTENTKPVYLPSVKGDVDFSPLSVKQQKQLLSGSVDSKAENLSFVNSLNDVLQENCKSDTSMMVYDRALIALQIRSNMIGDELIITHDDKEYKISIKSHVRHCRNTLVPPSSDFTSTTGDVVIDCKQPTLATDTKFNRMFTKAINKKTKQDVSLTDVIGDMYIHELLKFIKTITVNQARVEFADLSVEQMVNVFESLPITVSNNLADQIKTAREYETSCVKNEALPDGVTIPVDVSLFTSSE